MLLQNPNLTYLQPHKHLKTPTKQPKSCSTSARMDPGFETLAEITHNKVLIASTLSAIIGQFSKPLTKSILYGNKNKNFINFKTVVQSGGFPSTHSSAVVAAATLLGLERGFGDSVFGLSVVYAAIVMYDAQGVRREVGIHAKRLNKIGDESENLMKESVGHSEIEVFAGALLGFLVSIAVYNFM